MSTDLLGEHHPICASVTPCTHETNVLTLIGLRASKTDVGDHRNKPEDPAGIAFNVEDFVLVHGALFTVSKRPSFKPKLMSLFKC